MASLLVLQQGQICLMYTKFKFKHFGLFVMAGTQFAGRQINRKMFPAGTRNVWVQHFTKLSSTNSQCFYLWEILYPRTQIPFIGSTTAGWAFPLCEGEKNYALQKTPRIHNTSGMGDKLSAGKQSHHSWESQKHDSKNKKNCLRQRKKQHSEQGYADRAQTCNGKRSKLMLNQKGQEPV